MKFSLLFEMQMAEATAAFEQRVFHDAVAQAELADRLGYHCVWTVEHHGLRQYSHSSAPEVFLAFVAARTRRIRVGHGVTLLPFAYNHPIRVAERIAALDILSEGRVNFGSGKSSSQVEQRAFQVDPSLLGEQWEEALRMIVQIWRTPEFQYQSSAFSIPATTIVPKPVQQPHPPLFAACTSPGSAERAAHLGLGALCFSQGTFAALEQQVQAYRDVATRAVPIGVTATQHFACAPAALVLPDDRQACRYGFRGARFFGSALEHYYKAWQPGAALTAPVDFLPEEMLTGAMALRDRDDSSYKVICGDPAFARDYIRRFQALGVDELILVMQMGTVPSELVLESIKTFGEQVLPHFC
jgi:alkanesulfonate monooxygenase SsuD/methylene tetrahydromethanopterin reductase-like flavin-dependent oxidoreductase (luciferase family)